MRRTRSIAYDGQEDEADELLADVARGREAVDGIDEPLCGDSNKLRSSQG